MDASKSPFPAEWWGQGIVGVRPDQGTYGSYDYRALPALPYRLNGTFDWLAPVPRRRYHIGQERRKEVRQSLPSLIGDAAANAVELPAEFTSFMGRPDLRECIRSCTDCFLDLCPALVASPVGGGHLVRFLADSQGCVFWYIHIPAAGPDHAVIASTRLFGTRDEISGFGEPDDDGAPHTDERGSSPESVFCAESFEQFMCRFWLENEIWYADHKGEPLSPEALLYLDAYGRPAEPP